ncbi:chymotrypsin-1-like [Argonauta hians]
MKCFLVLSVIVLFKWGTPNGVDAQSHREHRIHHRKHEHHPHRHSIIGGTDASSCEFPWMVALIITSSKGTFLCGGSIIDDQHILTAAHCMQGAVQVRVSAGGNNRFNMETNIIVDKPNIHANRHYTGPNLFQNDIAILSLPRKLTFNGCIQPIPLAKPGSEFYSNCYIAGWGETEDGSPSTELKTTAVQLLLASECKSYFPGVTDMQVCGGSGYMNGPEACHGDSGGPLMCFNAKNEELTIVGVTSYGEPKCQNGMVVYENVAYFASWINKMRNA